MLTLCGPSQSGKTFWMLRLIEHIDVMIEPVPEKIIYMYTMYQPIYDKMKSIVSSKKDISRVKSIEFVDCNKSIPDGAELKQLAGYNSQLILDDLMVKITTSRQNMNRLDDIVSRDSHHLNMSVIFVVQNMVYGGQNLRTARVNSHYQVVFKNLSDFRNVMMVANNRKINPNEFRELLDEMNKRDYGYLVFDGSPRGPSNAQLRTNIFPGECTIVYDI